MTSIKFESTHSDTVTAGREIPLAERIKRRFLALKSVRYVPATNADVLIVDQNHGEIAECLEPNVTRFDLPVRGEAWYLNPGIIYNLLRYSGRVVAGEIGLRGWYILAVAAAFHTRVVITLIDNNNWDKGLVELDQFRLMCIQNGFRRLPELEGKTFDVYCTLNELPENLFEAYGITINNIVLTGSLRLSVFERLISRDASISESRVSYDGGPLKVLLPSGFRLPGSAAGWGEEKNRIQREGESKICEWLADMEREGLVRVTVALTTGADLEIEAAEIAYYGRLFGYQPEMSYRRENRWATYLALMNTDVTVGAGSTILLESRELGIPTLFCFSVYNEQHDEFYKLGVLEESIDLLVRNAEYTDFRAAVLGLGKERIGQTRRGRNAAEVIRVEVSKLLANSS